MARNPMPNQPLDEPTTKITINVYTADLEVLRRREGYGWSKVLRSLLRRWDKGQRVIEETKEETADV